MSTLGERGSAAFAVIVAGAAGAIAIACVGASVTFATQAHLQSRAEVWALTGADALSGRVAGYACETVRRMAENEGVSVRMCSASDLDLRIILSQRCGPLELTARAHAGPEKSRPNLTSR